MRLTALNKDNVELVRKWRNEDLVGFRTPYHLTEKMQDDFYENVVCNRNSPHRFFAVEEGIFIGMVGLTNIQWENGLAEISIVINPAFRGKGKGIAAVALLLDHGFKHMRLENIFAECYTCNPSVEFWDVVSVEYKASRDTLPMRKYYNGRYWESNYYNFNRGEWDEIQNRENYREDIPIRTLENSVSREKAIFTQT